MQEGGARIIAGMGEVYSREGRGLQEAEVRKIPRRGQGYSRQAGGF